MLHLARRISLSVDVGDFFQLEGAFQSDGIVNAAAKKKKILRTLESLGQLFAFFVVSQNVLKLAGNEDKLLGGFASLFGRHGASHLCDIKSEEIKGGELAGESFGRGHADLGSGMGIDSSGGFAGNHRTDDIANRQSL